MEFQWSVVQNLNHSCSQWATPFLSPWWVHKLTNSLLINSLTHFLIYSHFCCPKELANLLQLAKTMQWSNYWNPLKSGFLLVCTFHSSLDMHNAAHTMMISYIATSAWLIDFCHKATVYSLKLKAWKVFQEILQQILGSHGEIPEDSQCNGEQLISRIIFTM